MQQVLSNLLDNALKFSPSHTEVAVSLSLTKAGAVRLAVRDHGLYITREIVELHSGKIHAESPGDGGARFIV